MKEAQSNRRVYLHIGEPKTGTSFLQHALWGNRARLAAQGVVLPGYSNGGHARASQDLRGTPRLPTDPTDPWTGEWDVLVGQALRVRHSAVISNELLAACGPRQADRAVRSLLAAQVHIVITVRDFAGLLPAEWQESVKTRGTAPWEEWLDQVADAAPAADRRRQSWFWRVHDTLAILALWSQHLPPDQIHVVTVPRRGSKDDLWLRFASVLGIESEPVELPTKRSNASLGLAETEFLRRLNEALPQDVSKWFYTWTIKRILAQDVLAARPRQERLVLPPGRAAWAREQADVLVAGLRQSKYDIVGDLDDLLPQPDSAPYIAPADVPIAHVLDAAVHAAAALADRQFRGDVVASSGDTGDSEYPARPPKPISPHGRAGQLLWAKLKRSRVKRIIYGASRHPAAQHLRIAAWRVLARPGRGGR